MRVALCLPGTMKPVNKKTSPGGRLYLSMLVNGSLFPGLGGKVDWLDIGKSLRFYWGLLFFLLNTK